MSAITIFFRTTRQAASAIVPALALLTAVELSGCANETTGAPAVAGDEDAGGAQGEARTGGTDGAANDDDLTIEPLCDEAGPGEVRCFAQMVVRPDTAPAPANVGLTPNQIQSAYRLSPYGGEGGVVAIVDAFDNPNVEADLAVYRSHFGLPPCTTANGCFKKVNQRGEAGSYPKGDPGWGGEISLDVDAVSAACPRCSILLVEADSAKAENLAAGVATAARLGASAISNSYGMAEQAKAFAWYGTLGASYHHPGVAVVASAGDGGFGVNFPADLPDIVAVGGTRLTNDQTTPRGWVETVWGQPSGKHGTGSGCSTVFAKPAYQKDTGCAKRAVADVSAVADPATGLGVYDTFVKPGGKPGWFQVGGTSLSAPLIAAAMVSAGVADQGAAFFYSHAATMHDVVTGSDGTCNLGYLCTAGAGYDGPTGLGTPNAAEWPGKHGRSCYTATLGQIVPANACVQSKYDEQWYQCKDDSWVPRWQDPDECSSSWPLVTEGCDGRNCPQ